jgi:isoamylase
MAAIKSGTPNPLGARVTEDGVNFSIFSSLAETMQLLLFDTETSAMASRVIDLDRRTDLTGHYWHVAVPEIGRGQVYGYRAGGTYAPGSGLRFQADKVLLDPYGRAVSTSLYDRAAATRQGDNQSTCLRSVVVDPHRYDWEGDRPLQTSFRDTVIYEMHVAGFTRNPNSRLSPEVRGTYSGVIEKIAYLTELGITAVELMPVFQFDSQDGPTGLENYWGYSPLSFFSPHLAYSRSKSPLACVDEFRDMVKALHRAGIEVILDVVYNHTAEGGEGGPTFCYKGLDNATYYILTEDQSRYADFTGTGHTLNANQAVVRRLILDSLRYWVSEMHVDGFRFDLASVLSRNEHGTPVDKAPVLWDIDSDPVLAGTKLIAEAWDAAGLYQVGSFSGDRWKEWNGRFRDDVRSFVKSDPGMTRSIAQRITGSPDLYSASFQPPEQSINYVTAHDGFTLNDLVSYDDKHNQSNGEQNSDGSPANLSWNCGAEGQTNNEEIERLRAQQVRNFLCLTLMSIGTPMLQMGDECGRTQNGNNNAYCQNNETSWLDWHSYQKDPGLRRFVTNLIQFRKHLSSTTPDHNLSLRDLLDQAHIDWHGVKLHCPDFSNDSRTLAVTGYGQNGRAFHFMFNAFWEEQSFDLPPCQEPAQSWLRAVDTFRPPPLDISDGLTEAVGDPSYLVKGRSIVALVSA